MDDIEQATFDIFARLHPVEAHESHPDEFWEFVQRECPGISREKMIEILANAAEEEAQC